MKYYRVQKCEGETWKDYGVMCEEDMKLITRGYKQDKVIDNLYTRRGSRNFFIVDEA